MRDPGESKALILVVQAKLLPTPEQHAMLLRTVERMNTACCWLAERAFAEKWANKRDLQRRHYQHLRREFCLSSQMALLVVARVCEAYCKNKNILPVFRPHGAVPYDQRIYTFKKKMTELSLLTLDGRIILPMQLRDIDHVRLRALRAGQLDLVLRDGMVFAVITLEVTKPAEHEPDEFIGFDFGIKNIAVDSDGGRYTGAELNGIRLRHAKLRAKLQSKGTKSAKRLLKKRRRKEYRFSHHTNHCISKSMVTRAKDTGRGIALEDLKGIRDRVTVRKAQRRVHHSWGFSMLREFVTYKAVLAGVMLRLVDPRNTSRTCPECGHCEKKNRKSQESFVCVACGFAGHADHVAARNIRARAESTRVDELRRGDVNRPYAAVDEVAVSHGHELQGLAS